jgi:hypothetical protein
VPFVRLSRKLAGSPYDNKEDFLVDYYYHTVKAVRDAGGRVPTGGLSFGWDEPGMFGSHLWKLVEIYGQAWTDRNFNFYSVHHYHADPGDINVGDIRAAFWNAGLNGNRLVLVDEWNYTTDWSRGADVLGAVKAIGYAGKSLAKFVKAGVNATYLSAYPRQSLLADTVYEDGGTIGLSFFTATGTLLPQSYPFKILSNRLGLGREIFSVRGVSHQTVIDACAAMNSVGQKVAFIANDYDSPNTVNVTIKALPASQVAITEYWADSWNPACVAYKTMTKYVARDRSDHVINLLPETCVGLVFASIPTNAITKN